MGLRKDDRGLGLIEMVVIVLIIAALTALLSKVAGADELGEEYEKYYLTCYCPESCPGEITYTGAKVREGIAAVRPEHIGDYAMVYTVSGDFIGGFECLDKLGTGHKGVIDIWKPDMASARELMALTRGRCLIRFIKHPKG